MALLRIYCVAMYFVQIVLEQVSQITNILTENQVTWRIKQISGHYRGLLRIKYTLFGIYVEQTYRPTEINKLLAVIETVTM
jgi:hypothetical protein